MIAARGRDGDDRDLSAGREPPRERHPAPHPRAGGVSPKVHEQAEAIAARILTGLDYVGVTGRRAVRAATTARLLVNEIAPRVHNSGHWTLDGCEVDQFEQHIRAIAGWPLGPVHALAQVEMENLIGDDVDRWPRLIGEAEARLWLYGKAEARAGRKMGHVNRLPPAQAATDGLAPVAEPAERGGESRARSRGADLGLPALEGHDAVDLGGQVGPGGSAAGVRRMARVETRISARMRALGIVVLVGRRSPAQRQMASALAQTRRIASGDVGRQGQEARPSAARPRRRRAAASQPGSTRARDALAHLQRARIDAASAASAARSWRARKERRQVARAVGQEQQRLARPRRRPPRRRGRRAGCSSPAAGASGDGRGQQASLGLLAPSRSPVALIARNSLYRRGPGVSPWTSAAVFCYRQRASSDGARARGFRFCPASREDLVIVQIFVRDNNVDQALKALKKKMQREGSFREMKRHVHYEKPSEKRARQKAEAVRRARKLARKRAQREGLLPAPKKAVAYLRLASLFARPPSQAARNVRISNRPVASAPDLNAGPATQSSRAVVANISAPCRRSATAADRWPRARPS